MAAGGEARYGETGDDGQRQRGREREGFIFNFPIPTSSDEEEQLLRRDFAVCCGRARRGFQSAFIVQEQAQAGGSNLSGNTLHFVE